MGHSLSVILPLYNEENIVRDHILKVFNFLQKNFKDFEIILVNDGSLDKTGEIIKSLCIYNKHFKYVSYKKNMGKGFAVKQGVKESNKEIIIFMDIDLSTPLIEISKKINLINKFDVVIGSRALSQSKIMKKQKWYRIVLGRLGNFLIRFLLIPGIKDTQCGFKIFKGNIARKIFPMLTIFRWGFDFEILYLYKKFSFSIKEIPVIWQDSQNSKLNFLAYFTTFLELFKIKWNNLWRKYPNNL